MKRQESSNRQYILNRIGALNISRVYGTKEVFIIRGRVVLTGSTISFNINLHLFTYEETYINRVERISPSQLPLYRLFCLSRIPVFIILSSIFKRKTFHRLKSQHHCFLHNNPSECLLCCCLDFYNDIYLNQYYYNGCILLIMVRTLQK